MIYYRRSKHISHDMFGHECYVYNRNGELVYDGALEEVELNTDGNLEVKNKEGKAIITPKGKFITPFCRKCVLLQDSLYKVISSQGLCGVFDNSIQKMILPYSNYKNLLYVKREKVFLCLQYRSSGRERNYSIINKNGDVIFTLNAECIGVLNEKCLIVTCSDDKRDSVKGIYSFEGKNIVSVLYDEVLCSDSATEFLAIKENCYTLYDIDGKVNGSDSYCSISYHTLKGEFSNEGTVRYLGMYSDDEDYIQNVICPVFIELIKKKDEFIRSSIVNMKNEIIIPLEYVCLREIMNSNNELIGFKAKLPNSTDYINFNITGKNGR